MTTPLSSSEQKVVLANITWDLYEGLLAAHRDSSVPRFTYDKGCLEIMSPSAEHERIKEKVALLVNIVAEEKGISVDGFGSATFRRQDLDRGFEPDACFYAGNLHRVRGKAELDLAIDPPPDLVIEIDITSSSLDKFSILAQVGVTEIWYYDKTEWKILRLQGSDYAEQTESVVLPGLTREVISGLLEESLTLEPLAWLRLVRQSARADSNRRREV